MTYVVSGLDPSNFRRVVDPFAHLRQPTTCISPLPRRAEKAGEQRKQAFLEGRLTIRLQRSPARCHEPMGKPWIIDDGRTQLACLASSFLQVGDDRANNLLGQVEHRPRSHRSDWRSIVQLGRVHGDGRTVRCPGGTPGARGDRDRPATAAHAQPRSTRMKAIQAHPQQGLDGLTLVDLPDPGDPGPNAIRVRVHATSLNYHDLGVVTGRSPAADGRIPMADGAGVVEAVGSEITEFRPGNHVVSTFFPTWLDGEATRNAAP